MRVNDMKRVYVNEKWCLGCHLCEYNCAFANSGGKYMFIALKEMILNPRIRIEEAGSISFAVSCRHCKEPLCVKSCISGAMHIENGVVTLDKSKCVGCCTCVLVCPYGAVSTYEEGVIQKCELCAKNSAGTPACVTGCPNGAIVFEERQETP